MVTGTESCPTAFLNNRFPGKFGRSDRVGLRLQCMPWAFPRHLAFERFAATVRENAGMPAPRDVALRGDPMGTAHAKIRDLARQLIASEAAQDRPPGRHGEEAVRVCETLRVLLSRLVGVAGFRSLLSRALALARSQTPALGVVRIGADGALEGFDEVEPAGDPGPAEDRGVVLVAQLLGLLLTLIGPSLTLRVVRDGWPDASWDGIDLRTGEAT